LRTSDPTRLLLPLVWSQDVPRYPPPHLAILLHSTQFLVQHPDDRSETARHIAATIERAKGSAAAAVAAAHGRAAAAGALVVAHAADRAAAEDVREQAQLALPQGDAARLLLADQGGGGDGLHGAKEMIEDAAVVVLVGSPELAGSREALALVSYVVGLAAAASEQRCLTGVVSPVIDHVH
jgi:hypothetical protein